MTGGFERLGRMLGGERALRFIGRSSDIMLAFFVVILVMVIIIPITPAIIDSLVAVNLTISILILMVALYIQRAVNLSMFPSILLLTTLFRLSIEISATRDILLRANAGHIIYTFGSFVVQSNFVVGFIIYLIITVVQFIVVVKGAERVAEVAARFTLDAMPGKQMSIDADLRSGVIDTQLARELRLGLAKESQLYGAMDGAMKFVKGDVIAAIVIFLVNIIGGLIVGVLFHHMTMMQAVHTYTILSIGSGLVTQMPSLLIAMSAGIVTTRVSSEKKEDHLGKEITGQLLAQPKALMLASGVIFLMGLIHGFPTFLFAFFALVIGGIGFIYWWYPKKAEEKERKGMLGASVQTDVEGHAMVRGGTDEYALTLPVIIEVGSRLSEELKKARGGATFVEEMVPKMRHALYQDLGVRFPGVHVRTESPHLEPDEYSIFLNEVPLVRGKILQDALLTSEPPETLRRYNIPFTSTKSSTGQPSTWVDAKYEQILTKASIKFWGALEVMILHLSYFYRQYASEFLGIQEVRGILEFIEKSYPDLIKEVTRLVPLQKLTEIFKRLVQEQVSIKDLRTILEALSEWAQTEKDTVLLTEYIRSSLKRYISYKYSQGQSILAVYLLDPEIEDMIRAAIKQTSAGSYLALDPDTVQLILSAMRAVIAPTPAGGQPPVLLTAIDVRRFARKLIEGEFPDLPVVSYQEIVPEIRIQPLGRVQLT